MVLHLLGKKSWNVYNSENVERVRRDEAAAEAREEAEEQRQQEEDAARRVAFLRGDRPPTASSLHAHSAEEAASQEPDDERKQTRDHDRPRKRRRVRGEDDTDRDIRYAREDAEAGDKAKQALLKRESNNDDAPLHDDAGHIQLIPAPDETQIRKAEKNAEFEAEKAKKKKREEDQYTMRFSNAAGFKQGMEKPWYTASTSKPPATSDSALVLAEMQGKDIWGNEDPRRQQREQTRMTSSDPFATMQQAQQQLKQSEKDREKWQRERRTELEELKRSEHRKKRSRKRDVDGDSLDGFSLDAPVEKQRERSDHERHRKHRHHRRRSRSRSRSRERRHTSKRHSSRG